jgi:PAS domain S-box-containing protein
MSEFEKESSNILNKLTELEDVHDLGRETAQDALSILLDAVNSSINGLIITDLKGMIRFANPAFCKMFEYSPEEIIGEDAANLFTTKTIRLFSDVMALIDLSQNNTGEFAVENKDGGIHIVEVTASNVTSSSGKLVGRMASFIDITQKKEIETERESLISKLQDALDRIKTLRGIIPICASCKKIRDDQGYWNQIESYIKDHSEADFSHGICPDCAKRLYPDFYK